MNKCYWKNVNKMEESFKNTNIKPKKCFAFGYLKLNGSVYNNQWFGRKRLLKFWLIIHKEIE